MSQPSTSTARPAERPQADPLPSKTGEIGYVTPKSPQMRQANVSDDPILPAHHPADRDHQAATAAAEAARTNSGPATTTSTGHPDQKGWIQRFSYRGVSPVTILRILMMFLFLAGTGVAWAFTVIRVSAESNQQDQSSDPKVEPEDGRIRLPSSFSSLVFVHVSFTIVALFELLFLERAFFHARAERFLFKHGLPRRASAIAALGLAPWSRPPLPTYAAALAESGVGTGDVEDNLIAIPPPPAYGNTRGSRMILTGFLPHNLSRPLSRTSENTREENPRSKSPESQMEEGRGRPLSYEAVEEIDNAKRARELELALAKLEDNHEKLEEHARRP